MTQVRSIKRKEEKMVARKESIGEKIARRVELMAADFLAARGYAIFDARLAAQMLAMLAKNN